MAYRAFFALPTENFSTATGQVTNAVYGFTAMLANLLRDEEPTHLAVAFDLGRVTFRTAEYAEYKGTRAQTPEEFRGQVPLIQDVLGALRIPWLVKETFEADDVIATLATRARAEGFDVLICTGDRDALQLVDEHTTVLYPRKGVSELTRFTPEAVVERYGVEPARYPDLAALVGESSDNLPGIPGVGPKTAAKWIQAYGSLEELLARADAVTGKAGENLRAHLDQVRLNRRLNALVRDLDLDLGPADLAAQPWDREAMHRVFDALEFRTLRERLFAMRPAEDDGPTSAIDLVITALEPGGLGTWLAARAGRRLGLDVLGRGVPVGADAWGVAVSDGAQAVTLDLASLVPADDAELGAWLADPSAAKVLHGAKEAWHAVRARGWTLEGVAVDTALAAYLCHPDQRDYDLPDLAVRYLHRELRPQGGAPAGEQATLALDLDDDESEQSATRATVLVELAEVLDGDLRDRGVRALLDDVELPLVGVLGRMEAAGIAADTGYLSDLERAFAEQVAAAEAAAFSVIGREVNLGSPKQLQEVLFTQLEMPPTKKIKTGYTTDAAALADLFRRTEHPFLAHLLAHRDATRLRQTVEGLLRSVAPDGRIHTRFQQTIAATGRLSSTDPNLQNIPIRTEAGRQIRRAFVVGEGYDTLLTADYSQIEMRIMAHLSADEGLIAAFRSGEDLHRFVGSRVFGVEPAEVTAEMRSRIKAMSYGLAYGLSSYGLSQQLGIDVAEANALMTDYFARFGGVRDYLAGVVDEARRTGYTQTILGRRRYLPDLTHDNRQRRDMAERMALNAPIQGSAADLIKVAMLGVDRELRERGLRSRLLLQVHDELVLELAPGEREDVEELVRRQMAGAADLSVPLDVSVGAGRSWHEAGH